MDWTLLISPHNKLLDARCIIKYYWIFMDNFNKQRNLRLMNALSITTGSLGILAILLKDYFLNFSSLSPAFIIILPIVLVLFSLSFLLLNYLRTGRLFHSSSPHEDLLREELSLTREEFKERALINEHNSKIYSDIEQLKKVLSDNNLKDSVLSESEKISITSELKKEIFENTSESILLEIKEKYSKEIRKDKYLKDLRSQCKHIRNRLMAEIEALGRRGNLNLVIGVITTIAAGAILASTVLSGNHQLTQEEIVAYYAPRLTLSIFIEIFSFFFLRLYKAGLSEIKYFQNELTNAEMKFIAIEKAVMFDTTDTISNVIKELVTTERNFKLGKGESTVDLEKYRTEQASSQKVLDSLSAIIGKQN